MTHTQYIRHYREFEAFSPPMRLFLYGECGLMKENLIIALKKAMQGFEDFNMDVIWMNEMRGKDAHKKIFDSLLQLPMLGDRRLLILRSFDISRAVERKVIDGLSKMDFPETSILAIEAQSLDKRWKEGKKIVESFRIVELKTPNRRDMADWIVHFARREGKKIKSSAVQELINLSGISLSVVREEIRKLATYIDGDTIDVSHIREAVAQSRAAHIFQFSNAFIALDFNGAMKTAMELMDFGEEPGIILSWMHRGLSDFLWARIDSQGLSKRMGSRAFLAKQIRTAVRNIKSMQIMEAMQCLHHADMMIKSSAADKRTSVAWAIGKISDLLS